MPVNQLPIAHTMSVRVALTALVVTVLVSFSSIVPESPDKVRWILLFWLSVYAGMMLVQTAWLGWQWLTNRHTPSTQRGL
jgi:hypothetical protein